MPTYTFRCRKCGKDIEVVHSFNEPHPETCQCGGELQRIFQNPQIIYNPIPTRSENDDALNVLLNVSSSAPIKKQHRLYRPVLSSLSESNDLEFTSVKLFLAV